MPSDDTRQKLQALLLVSHRPLKLAELAKTLQVSPSEIKQVLAELKSEYNVNASGMWLTETTDAVQLTTSPKLAGFIKDYLKVEAQAELTKPSLETLTIITYSGPLAKHTLDRIRGVNCALILRNLMIKGLVEEVEVKGESMYQVSMDFVKHLGLADISELPEYDKFHRHEYIVSMMGQEESATAPELDDEI